MLHSRVTKRYHMTQTYLVYLPVHFPELSELTKKDSSTNKSSGNNISPVLVKEGRGNAAGGWTGERERGGGCGLELTVENISLEMFSFTVCCKYFLYQTKKIQT